MSFRRPCTGPRKCVDCIHRDAPGTDPQLSLHRGVVGSIRVACGLRKRQPGDPTTGPDGKPLRLPVIGYTYHDELVSCRACRETLGLGPWSGAFVPEVYRSAIPASHRASTGPGSDFLAGSSVAGRAGRRPPAVAGAQDQAKGPIAMSDGSPRAAELKLLDAAIARQQAKLDGMEREWRNAGALCCPACMFGSDYSKVEEKLERQLAWRQVLARATPARAPAGRDAAKPGRR